MTTADVILSEAVRLWRMTLSRGTLVDGAITESEPVNEVAKALIALSRAPWESSKSRPVVDEAAGLIADAVSLAQVVSLVAMATEGESCPSSERQRLREAVVSALEGMRAVRSALQTTQGALGPSAFAAKTTLMAEREKVPWEQAARMERSRFNS